MGYARIKAFAPRYLDVTGLVNGDAAVPADVGLLPQPHSDAHAARRAHRPSETGKFGAATDRSI